jgi:hypothetical protein
MKHMANPAVAIDAPKEVGSIGRVFGVFFSPRETFQSIARCPSWLLPLALICVTSLGVSITLGARVGWTRLIINQLQKSSQFQSMSADQQQRVFAMQAKYAPISAYVGVVVVSVGLPLLVSAVFLAVFNVLSGAEIKFKTSLAIASHAYLPGIVSAIFSIIVILLKDPSTVDPQRLLATNVGAYLSGDRQHWFVTLLGSVDLFSFWIMLLLAVGYSVASPKKVSFRGALASVLLVWAAYVIVRVSLAAL